MLPMLHRRWLTGFLVAAALPLAVYPQSEVVPDSQPLPEYVAPNLYTPDNVVQAMLDLAKTTRDDIVYDLGSGDGRIVIAAAKQFGAHAVGIDIDQRQIELARNNAELAGVADRVRFIQADLFSMDFSEATVVTLYLGVRANARLAPILETQLEEGTRVVSHQFDIPDWYPEKRLMLRDEHRIERELYLWTVGRHRVPPLRIE